MKNLFVICTLMFSSLAFASDNIDASAWLSSDYLYRGVSLSDGDEAAGFDFRASDVIVDGVYVSTQAAAWDLGDADVTRLDAGLGFGGHLGDGKLGYSFGAHRVISSEWDSYSELRAGVFSDLASNIRVYGEVAQLVEGRDSKDTFLEAGVKLEITDAIWASVSAAALRSQERDDFDFNHAAVSAGWEFFSGLSVVGTYSHGGDRLENEHSVAVRYSF